MRILIVWAVFVLLFLIIIHQVGSNKKPAKKQKPVPEYPVKGQGDPMPFAWIVEGTSTTQCLCPDCDYGKGYNQPFIYGNSDRKICKCPTCGLEFIGLV